MKDYSNLDIHYLQRDEIIEKKWDACISRSSNALVYAYCWYLDIVCDEWNAIVLGDYNAILPLPLKRFLLWSFVKLPKYIPELGIISQEPLNQNTCVRILKAIPFAYVNMTMNAHNHLPQKLTRDQKSYPILDLIQSSQNIFAKPNSTLQNAIKNYSNKQIIVLRTLTVAEYINFDQENTRKPTIGTTFKQLLSFANRYKSAGFYAAYDETNRQIAQAFLIKSNKRLYLLHYSTLREDFDLLGPTTILYHIIKNNAESDLTLSFSIESKKLGKTFTRKEHVCSVYKKWFFIH